MNEHQLRRLLRRLVLLSAPLPLAVLGAACGGAASVDTGGAGGATAQGGKDGIAGAAQAGAASGGAGAGSGGAIAVAGAGGSIGGAGAGGNIGVAGAAGKGAVAGAGGSTNECNGNLPSSCAPATATVPRSCVTPAQAMKDAQLPMAVCNEICGSAASILGCSVNAVTSATLSVLCQPGCAVGRRPAGLGELGACDARAAGSYFSEIAHLEAASVTAFRILRDELRAQGAPKKLVRAAGRAARDEIRHTRATGALARRYGATPRVPQIAPAKARSLEAMALENAIEGCVRETYGALLATRQAKLATDPVVRAAMMRIARDETRHASLSWSVGRWLEARLAPSAKRNIERAKRAAADELLSSLANENEVSFAALAGLPSPAQATQLASEMQRALWS